ncbi:putative reverse transcriptase domain-containing protein [Tanacetum coccineum]
MSSASSAVTYTSVYTDSEPGRVFWGADEELSNGGSPRVIVYGYDGLPMQPVALLSLDYVLGPEHPPSPDYVPGPEHPPSPVEVPYVPEPDISNCPATSQVKFATCTLQDDALTWWNSHVKTTTPEVAHAMPWAALKKMMTDKYCPRETDKIERYVGGMPDLIYSSVVASKLKTMQEAIEMATELMDRRINTFAERHAENKGSLKNTPRITKTNNLTIRQNKQGLCHERDKTSYEGTIPLCPTCNFNITTLYPNHA